MKRRRGNERGRTRGGRVSRVRRKSARGSRCLGGRERRRCRERRRARREPLRRHRVITPVSLRLAVNALLLDVGQFATGRQFPIPADHAPARQRSKSEEPYETHWRTSVPGDSNIRTDELYFQYRDDGRKRLRAAMQNVRKTQNFCVMLRSTLCRLRTRGRRVQGRLDVCSRLWRDERGRRRGRSGRDPDPEP